MPNVLVTFDLVIEKTVGNSTALGFAVDELHQPQSEVGRRPIGILYEGCKRVAHSTDIKM
ncbi:hypothetical protein DIE14_01335 [Burkholderia sp. Bp9017]|nr:hypothetical protein DIE14_01335 [Burkholderia sp. Bp9017]RQZ37719.1 hypothetical protein DIE13_01325 [Burkholderia sp. Bp9016]